MVITTLPTMVALARSERPHSKFGFSPYARGTILPVPHGEKRDYKDTLSQGEAKLSPAKRIPPDALVRPDSDEETLCDSRALPTGQPGPVILPQSSPVVNPYIRSCQHCGVLTGLVAYDKACYIEERCYYGNYMLCSNCVTYRTACTLCDNQDDTAQCVKGRDIRGTFVPCGYLVCRKCLNTHAAEKVAARREGARAGARLLHQRTGVRLPRADPLPGLQLVQSATIEPAPAKGVVKGVAKAGSLSKSAAGLKSSASGGAKSGPLSAATSKNPPLGGSKPAPSALLNSSPAAPVGKIPGTVLVKSPGKIPAKAPGKIPGKIPGQVPGKIPGTAADKVSGLGAGLRSGAAPGSPAPRSSPVLTPPPELGKGLSANLLTGAATGAGLAAAARSSVTGSPSVVSSAPGKVPQRKAAAVSPPVPSAVPPVGTKSASASTSARVPDLTQLRLSGTMASNELHKQYQAVETDARDYAPFYVEYGHFYRSCMESNSIRAPIFRTKAREAYERAIYLDPFLEIPEYETLLQS